MNGEKYYIFSQNEFLLMLLLAGGEGCTVGMWKENADSGSLNTALADLYARGFLKRGGSIFVPDGEGGLFFEISGSRYAVLLSASVGRTAVCYVCDGHVWACELMVDGLHVKRMSLEELRRWLLDSGIIEKPVLKDEDVGELGAISEDNRPSAGSKRLLSLEKYVNGGSLLKKTQVVRAGAVSWIAFTEGCEETAQLYTEESLGRMLEDVFCLGDR